VQPWYGKSIPIFLYISFYRVNNTLSFFVLKPDRQIKKLFFPNQKIIEDQSTRYGTLTITSQSGQLNFYENNVLQFYTDNISQCEEAVHIAMCQHQHPKNVLLLSGGITGMLSEIEKYPVEKITWLESNPEIIKHWKFLADSTIDKNNIEFIDKDIRNFLLKDNTIYDIILMNLPAPSSWHTPFFIPTNFLK
jgi:predicted membrane-bound spermidine synthase